ncbi:hypothetical protein SBOR_2478 [Sclerotinia borealis F-4128]|uniref:Uncharacterized protein n=1 Tax=Sclerotinia borealis (strain F-4128) TaxID=1432307 RepID=W9CRK3_SCLBF|nr:hypothetical protein SBOR_2478 [Sclerotinia borealis F-4128]
MHVPALALALSLLLTPMVLAIPNANPALAPKNLIENRVQRQIVKPSDSVAFCPSPGTAYCCNSNSRTRGTLCKWNGDGHLAGCELITGGESVCCTTLECKGMAGLSDPITAI